MSRDFFSQGVAETQPEWRMMDQFWSDVTQPALALDALATSHPVSVPVNDPKVYYTVSYQTKLMTKKISCELESMGARNQGGIGLSYRPARLHNRLAEFIPWNRFLGSINVQKYGL
jgi:hypothetical protein